MSSRWSHARRPGSYAIEAAGPPVRHLACASRVLGANHQPPRRISMSTQATTSRSDRGDRRRMAWAVSGPLQRRCQRGTRPRSSPLPSAVLIGLFSLALVLTAPGIGPGSHAKAARGAKVAAAAWSYCRYPPSARTSTARTYRSSPSWQRRRTCCGSAARSTSPSRCTAARPRPRGRDRAADHAGLRPAAVGCSGGIGCHRRVLDRRRLPHVGRRAGEPLRAQRWPRLPPLQGVVNTGPSSGDGGPLRPPSLDSDLDNAKPAAAPSP